MKPAVVIAASLAIVAGCAHVPQEPVVQAPAPPPAASALEGIDLAQLEDIFWTCDYVATTRGVDSTPMRECALATRELRRAKFDNSFHRMLDWWREHKPAEHDKRRRQRNDPQL